MAALRPIGRRGLGEEEMNPGDILMIGKTFVPNTTVGASTITAASIVSGNVYRSGSTGAYTDTLDSAANVLAALAGNNWAGAIVPGMGFEFAIQNSVAFVETLTLGAGWVAGQGVTGSVPASACRYFLATITSTQPPITVNANTSTSATITWNLPTGLFSLLQGNSPLAVNIQPGASVSGSGVPAGATVVGVTEGVGGTVGVTISAATTSTLTNTPITFGPTIVLNSEGSGTL